MYFGLLNTKGTLNNFFMEAFSRYQRSNFFSNFQSCSDIFEYISSSNWLICLNKHSNWRGLISLQLFILEFSDLPSSSDASNFNNMEKFDIVKYITIKKHLFLGYIRYILENFFI